MFRIEDIVVAGQRHGCRWNTENSRVASGRPLRPLLGRHLFWNEGGPTFRNVERGYLEVIRYINPDRDVVVRYPSVMNVTSIAARAGVSEV